MGFQEAGGGPSQGHLGVAPALDIVLHHPDRSQGILDGVGAGQGAPELGRQAQADHGEDLIQALQDGSRNAGGLGLQAARQVLHEAFGFLGIVLVPGLPERLLDAGMKAFVEALDDVAALVDLAALEGGHRPEGPLDRLGERLGAVDDEEPGHFRVEAAGGQVVEQRLHRGGILRGTFGQA